MRVIVVGGGVIGYATAYELARRGAHVAMIEARTPGGGATRASAGMLAPYIEGHVQALRDWGVRSLELWDGFAARVHADAGRPFEYKRTGTLQVARSGAACEELRQAASQLQGEGVRHALLDAPAARDLEPALSGAVNAALYVESHGYVRAAQLIMALRSACEHFGVEQMLATAEAMEETPDAVRVRVAGRALEADRVVVAAGSWAPALPPLRPPVKPMRGQLLHLKLEEQPLRHVLWGEGCYLVPWSDGSVLVGATMEDVGFDESITADAVSRLDAAARQEVPALAGASRVAVRVGLRPATSDELPIVGPSSTMRRVCYATGHYRNGVLLAPATAIMVADFLLDSRVDPLLAATRPARFGL